jgi:hypothetical protein
MRRGLVAGVVGVASSGRTRRDLVVRGALLVLLSALAVPFHVVNLHLWLEVFLLELLRVAEEVGEGVLLPGGRSVCVRRPVLLLLRLVGGRVASLLPVGVSGHSVGASPHRVGLLSYWSCILTVR